MENLDTQVLENTETQTDATTEVTTQAPPPPEFNWKTNLLPDYANSPTLKNFPDSKEGLNSAVKSHLELQKLLGHDKIPVPRGADDTVAMGLFKKAFKIPDKPEGYSLSDPDMPEALKDIKFDKTTFQNGMHKQNISPDQAKGLWNTYTDMVKQQYAEAVKNHETKMGDVKNQMRSEWGDAYQSKVEMGQLVVKKFSDSQDMNDFITASLTRDPMGIKFLAKIGEQFAENKIGDFKYQQYSQTPEQIDQELSSIRGDMNHPYNNSKSPEPERKKAIEYVNSLIAARPRTQTI